MDFFLLHQTLLLWRLERQEKLCWEGDERSPQDIKFLRAEHSKCLAEPWEMRNHFLHLSSRKESLPSRKIVVNSLELPEAKLTACHMNTEFLLLTIAGCQYSKTRKDSLKFLVMPGDFVHQGWILSKDKKKKNQQEQISSDSLSFSR